MLSRMFSDKPEQKRPNPTLEKLLALRACLEEEAGMRIPIDVLVEAIS